MKVTCHICQEENDDSICARILVAGETFYVHDDCGLEAIDEARAQKEEEANQGKQADLTDSEFLLDLAKKLRHVPPAVAGTDQYHSDRCESIAKNIQDAKTRLQIILAQLREVEVALNQKNG